jgi:hypothetical protein
MHPTSPNQRSDYRAIQCTNQRANQRTIKSANERAHNQCADKCPDQHSHLFTNLCTHKCADQRAFNYCAHERTYGHTYCRAKFCADFNSYGRTDANNQLADARPHKRTILCSILCTNNHDANRGNYRTSVSDTNKRSTNQHSNQSTDQSTDAISHQSADGCSICYYHTDCQQHNVIECKQHNRSPTKHSRGQCLHANRCLQNAPLLPF